MDKNQVIGLGLILLLLVVYSQIMEPGTESQDDNTTTQTTEQVEVENEAQEPIDEQPVLAAEVENDSLMNVLNQQRLGLFSIGANGTEEDIQIENEDMKMTFSSMGGVIKEVELKGFTTNLGEPLIILDGERSNTSLVAKHAGRDIDLTKLYYNFSKNEKGDSTSLIFNLQVSTNQFVRQTYTIPKNGYKVGYKLDLVGLEKLVEGKSVAFKWEDKLQNHENDVTVSRRKSTINYYTVSESFDGLSETSISLEEEKLSEPIKWVAMKQKFFTSAIVAKNKFDNGEISTSVDENDAATVKHAKIALSLPLKDLVTGDGEYTYYFGPNNYNILKKVTDGFSKNLYLGWFPVSMVNKLLIIPLFQFLENFIGNYGIIIMILVLVIKLLLSPLSYKSYVSMAKTKVLKPELDKIKEECGDDMQKVQSEQMKLYQKVGVNPLSGCIPVLLQMPILFAMFYFFPSSIELRQQGFLWASDLSTYDSIFSWNTHIPLLSDFYGNHVSLFTLLMTASTILYTWSNNQVSSVQGPMKSVSYMMPIIFMFVLNSFPAGLSFYYFISNLVTFGQQALIRKFVDEEKIKSILEENKKKNVNKKKSKFQQRLEEAMKANQENQKNQKKKK